VSTTLRSVPEAQISQVPPASDHHRDHHLPLLEVVRASPYCFHNRTDLQRRTCGNDQGPAADVWGIGAQASPPHHAG
jgi:hypothetical protein